MDLFILCLFIVILPFNLNIYIKLKKRWCKAAQGIKEANKAYE